MNTRVSVLILAILYFGVTIGPVSVDTGTHNLLALKVLHGIHQGVTEESALWNGMTTPRIPVDPAMRRLLGYNYLEGGRAELALKVLQFDGDECFDAIICFHQGKALLELGQREAAIAKWRNIRDIDIYFALKGNAAYDQGLLNESLRYYDLSLEISQSPAPLKAEMFANLCREQRKNNAMELAMASCSKAVASSRNYWRLVELGRTYYEAGRYELAEKTLQEAIEISPDQAVGYQWLGVALYRLGHTTAALDTLRSAVRLAPENVFARLHLGNTLSLEGEYVRAACEYERALALTKRESLIMEIRSQLESLPVTTEDLQWCEE